MTMNAVFEKNMEVLEKRYPDLAKKVRETKDNRNSSINRGNIFVHHLSGFLLSQE